MTHSRAGRAIPPLSTQELEDFLAFVYARTGMRFSSNKRIFVERRVIDRMSQLGLSLPADYLRRLPDDATEAQALVNSFTVNETYFYREQHQFACLSADLLPDIASRYRPGDRIRIWSNPCSTGEEPFSIAIWLLENWGMVDAYNVEIVGSDIDTGALYKAKQGRFGERSVSRLPGSVLSDYFEQVGQSEWQLIKDIRESVTFSQVNLADAGAMTLAGKFDVIFCRNLLIYFDEVSRENAARNLYHCLLPGGYLCLGHTETMSRLGDRFALRRFLSATVYQRPGSADG